MKSYIEVLKRYAVFTGRAKRREYWFFSLLTSIIVIVLKIIDTLTESFALEQMVKLYLLAILLPFIAVSVRRLHDTGRSGWWFLISLISLSPPAIYFPILPESLYTSEPIQVILPISILITIIWFRFMIQDSDPDNNQYGENPKGELEISKPNTKRNTIILILAVVFIFWIGHKVSDDTRPPRFITVPGPETIGMKNSFHGSILMERPVGGLVRYTLPNLEEQFIRTPGIETQQKGIVHSVSGPDNLGRIVYIEGHQDTHNLKVKNLTNGTENTIFTRPGDVLWVKAVGKELSLSPVGGLVAVLFNGSFHKEGDITIWNIESHQQLPVKIRGVDRGFSWFPDAEKLVYVKLLPKETVLNLLTSGSISMAGSDKEIQNANYPIPVVYQFDLNTGLSTPLSIGMKPLVSNDGKYIISKSLDYSWVHYDISSKIFQKIVMPGMINDGPIALLDANHVLYWSFPTEGTITKMTTNNSPLVGKKQMLSIKIANMKTLQFETLLHYVDPRRSISYGGSK